MTTETLENIHQSCLRARADGATITRGEWGVLLAPLSEPHADLLAYRLNDARQCCAIGAALIGRRGSYLWGITTDAAQALQLPLLYVEGVLSGFDAVPIPDEHSNEYMTGFEHGQELARRLL